ncbi:MAG: PIN domain-containing protein [Nanoarchaeota archaeon]|nr:PIN domain-containing protein [Nanoarchaeota archaeon]MBU1270527.1 PIN domain-containing protein [Nanoarchaeota archaeon]MBU1604260.1 PIN domain-containing protein [Nanoarchaeota archaeon]MBU2442841.1 PIN domain-containing protein [Nanoarchaeota archaeon]
MSVYFYDTYALAKLVLGDKEYEKYDQFDIVTSKLNLIELYLFMLRNKIEKPENIYYMFKESTLDIHDKTIFEAMKLKKERSKISYVDAIGYVIAQNEKVKFLTGDEEFKGMKNVEFQK